MSRSNNRLISTLGFSKRVFSRYLFYARSQKWNRQQIESYQDKKLIKIVRHAAVNVPYYRKIFEKIGLKTESFRGRVDMHKIPLLDKETLRIHQKDFIAENAAKYGINWDSTSGSTGTPLHFIMDHSSKAHKLAGVLRSYRWSGYFPGKKVFSLQSYSFPDPEALFRRYAFANLWRINARLLTQESALKIVAMINEIKPDIIIGYPFSIFMLSKLAKEGGGTIAPVSSIVTAGETLSEKRRSLLETAYGCRVHDFYSLHEAVSIISECDHQTKHISEDFAYNEVVDHEGNIVAENGTGELVGTGFYNYGMPLIRYKLGDTVVLNGQPTCQCGRQFKSVKEIIGRQNDYIITPDGRYMGNVLEHSVDNAKGVMLSQCVQDAVDRIYINLIVDESFNDDSLKLFEEGLRSRLGDEIRIEFKKVDALEKKPSGKTPFIYSKLGLEHI